MLLLLLLLLQLLLLLLQLLLLLLRISETGVGQEDSQQVICHSCSTLAENNAINLDDVAAVLARIGWEKRWPAGKLLLLHHNSISQYSTTAFVSAWW
jgi:hypothetical protein